MVTFENYLSDKPYPGRGIVIGRSDCGSKIAIAYFIMGRSENSRNRIFVRTEHGIATKAFDEGKVTDPNLIFYNAVRNLGNKIIVSNGDQTDTIYELMDRQYSFEMALRRREFEPDEPNYTPRISGIIHVPVNVDSPANYAFSVIKKGCCAESVRRFNFAYNNTCPGIGHFVHTYKSDGNPLPSFEGEPVEVEIRGNLGDFTDCIWSNLNSDNKISLYTRFADIKNGKYEDKIVNKYTRQAFSSRTES
jgi:hypothetical protein